MKKLIAVLLCLALVLSACGAKEEPATTATTVATTEAPTEATDPAAL